MDKEKTIKSVIGIGAVSLAAYLAYTQLTGEESQSIGGSGTFSGLGGAESLTEEGISGTSDSGVSYNINLPQVDTSGISALVSGGSSILDGGDSGGSGDSVITGGGEVKVVSSKKAAVNAGDSTKAETSGSLSSSLAQVFGTPAQKTNERGDYYTTSAGGGAGAVKGKSLGEMFIDTVKNVTTSKGVDTKIYTGASTASQKTIGDIDVKSVLQSDATKKASQMEAIKETKIAAPAKITDPLQELKDSGIVKSSSGSSNSITTTKKAASSSSSSSGIKRQGGSGTGESKVKIIRKS